MTSRVPPPTLNLRRNSAISLAVYAAVYAATITLLIIAGVPWFTATWPSILVALAAQWTVHRRQNRRHRAAWNAWAKADDEAWRADILSRYGPDGSIYTDAQRAAMNGGTIEKGAP